jgi:hypothetical protein
MVIDAGDVSCHVPSGELSAQVAPWTGGVVTATLADEPLTMEAHADSWNAASAASANAINLDVMILPLKEEAQLHKVPARK